MEGPLSFDAAVFDLDGVITRTAHVHMAAWKTLFDEYLRLREARFGEPFRPFTEDDYRAHVDGRPRPEGVRGFLGSRGIMLPAGARTDRPDAETVAGLAARKNEIFRARLRDEAIDVDDDAVQFVRELRSRGVAVGVASSSKNAQLILETTRLTGLFDACVDGTTSEQLGLRGKPAPDILLECLERLGAPAPIRAIVVEDATAGVRAGRAGGFGLVLGVDRGGNAIALYEHGADWVIHNFRDISPERLDAHFLNRRTEFESNARRDSTHENHTGRDDP